MFSVHCPHHGSDVLLSERRIRAMVPVDNGLQVVWECYCGSRGSFLTGRPGAIGRHRPAM